MEFNPDGYTNWLLDFDDTLVTSWSTWAIDHAFPKLISDHNLVADPDKLASAILEAQRQAPNDPDAVSLLGGLFRSMEWPHELIDLFMELISTQYTPSLFDDTLSFLDTLQARGCKLYAVTNNRRAGKIAASLGIDGYFDAIVTPKTCETCKAKPDSAMWAYLQSQVESLEPKNTLMLGDDPWSDADFSQNCGLQCLILDRLSRYSALEYGVAITSLNAAIAYAPAFAI